MFKAYENINTGNICELLGSFEQKIQEEIMQANFMVRYNISFKMVCVGGIAIGCGCLVKKSWNKKYGKILKMIGAPILLFGFLIGMSISD